jgi:Ca-activated chloride channel homolog
MRLLAEPLALVLLTLPWLLRKFLPALARSNVGPRLPPRLAVALTSLPQSDARLHWLALVCWGLIVLALAGPQWPRASAGLEASGRDIMLALDISGSMETADFELDGKSASRIATVKRIASDFIAARRGDATIAQVLGETEIGMAGRTTAIGDALGLSLKRLKDSAAKTRSIVLLSDGVNNAGRVEPLDAARLAKSFNIKIHTIAMGLEAASDTGGYTGIKVMRPAQDYDAEALSALSVATGGLSFRARTTAELTQAYAKLSQEMSSELPMQATVFQSLAHVPLTLAWLAGLLLIVRRRA